MERVMMTYDYKDVVDEFHALMSVESTKKAPKRGASWKPPLQAYKAKLRAFEDRFSNPDFRRVIQERYPIEVGLVHLEKSLENPSISEQIDLLPRIAALEFVRDAIRLARDITPQGKFNLQGKIRDGLNKGRGLFEISNELRFYQISDASNIQIVPNDLLEASPYTFDYLVTFNGIEYEVDSKTISIDTDNPINSQVLYQLVCRFCQAGIKAQLGANSASTYPKIRMIFDGDAPRLPGLQKAIVKTVLQMMSDGRVGTQEILDESGQRIGEICKTYIPIPDEATPNELIAGDTNLGRPWIVRGDAGKALLTFESKKMYNPARHLVSEMKNSARHQFSKRRPAIIIMNLHQYDDHHFHLLANGVDGGLPRFKTLSWDVCKASGCEHVRQVTFTSPNRLKSEEGNYSIPSTAIHLGSSVCKFRVPTLPFGQLPLIRRRRSN